MHGLLFKTQNNAHITIHAWLLFTHAFLFYFICILYLILFTSC
jgi:hypothetical protein